MTPFEKFIAGIKETTEEKFPFVFLVERDIISEEFRARLKIDGFSDNEIDYRNVLVPGNVIKELAHSRPLITEFLEKVFYWGQNDFNPVKGSPSVSVGDIIHFLNRKFKVESVGFKEIYNV